MRSAAVRGKLPSAVAAAMAGSTKGELRQPERARPHALAPRRRKFRERFGWRAREAA
jgi:hypothetical protein